MRSGIRIRVVSLNVWALPFGLARDTAARMQRLAASFADLEADLLAFQEVWTGAARATLVDAARAAGFAHVWHNRRTFGGSGLLVASRLPFLRTGFHRYDLAGIATHIHRGDYLAGKGFARIDLDTPLGPVRLVDTHLHAQYDPDGQDPYLGHRVGQAIELAADLRGLELPVLAVGDFNLREGRPEYRILAGLGHLRDAAVELDRREPTNRSGKRIDYVFVRNGSAVAARPQTLRRVYAPVGSVSDHAGLAAEIELVARPSPPPTPPRPALLDEAAAILAAGHEEAVERRARTGAGALALGLGGAAALGSRARLTRRRLLRTAVPAAGLLALPAAGLGAVDSGPWIGEEIEAFDRDAALLAGWR